MSLLGIFFILGLARVLVTIGYFLYLILSMPLGRWSNIRTVSLSICLILLSLSMASLCLLLLYGSPL